MMAGRLLSFCDGIFSRAMLNFQGVPSWTTARGSSSIHFPYQRPASTESLVVWNSEVRRKHPTAPQPRVLEKIGQNAFPKKDKWTKRTCRIKMFLNNQLSTRDIIYIYTHNIIYCISSVYPFLFHDKSNFWFQSTRVVYAMIGHQAKWNW